MPVLNCSKPCIALQHAESALHGDTHLLHQAQSNAARSAMVMSNTMVRSKLQQCSDCWKINVVDFLESACLH